MVYLLSRLQNPSHEFLRANSAGVTFHARILRDRLAYLLLVKTKLRINVTTNSAKAVVKLSESKLRFSMAFPAQNRVLRLGMHAAPYSRF
jgi:hypothetical protein